jgi:hypothetical protein
MENALQTHARAEEPLNDQVMQIATDALTITGQQQLLSGLPGPSQLKAKGGLAGETLGHLDVLGPELGAGL